MTILWHHTELCIDWMVEHIGDKFCRDENRQAIGYMRDGELRAAVSYQGFTGHDIEMGLLVTSPPSRAFIKAVFEYPFVQLRCLRVSAEVASKNVRMLALMGRLGFTQEGVKRGALPDDDYIVFGMTRAECKYL